MSEKCFAYVGTYTTENNKKNRNAVGKGVYVFEVNTETGEWTPLQVVEALNPAVLYFGAQQKYVYCCETNSGYMTAFKRDEETGLLTKINSSKSAGENIMVFSVDQEGKMLVSADHKGIITTFSLGEDGAISPAIQNFVLPGEKGPLNEKTQPWSRPHHTPFSPDRNFVHIPDKGLDCVHTYRVNWNNCTLEEGPKLTCRAASCPRHIWFHPNGNWAYVNTEFSCTIIACEYNNESGELKPFQIISSTPESYVGIKQMNSEIVVHPNGKHLYISNRGQDCISVFSIDPDSGWLTRVEDVPSKGRKPRFFAIEPGGRYLYAGNQSSDTIAIFELDPDTGHMTDTGRMIKTACPVWILFTRDVGTVKPE